MSWQRHQGTEPAASGLYGAGPGPACLLFVLSGPSGVGKDALLRCLKEEGDAPRQVVTATTRPRRPGEKDGEDYFFVSEGEFDRMRQQGELLEWARVLSYFYGTPVAQVRDALRAGNDVLLKIDVQGALQIRRQFPEAILIFLAPSVTEDLARRMRERGVEAGELEERLDNARAEMARLPEYDYVVINRDGALAQAVAQVRAIITAERCRVRPRRVQL